MKMRRDRNKMRNANKHTVCFIATLQPRSSFKVSPPFAPRSFFFSFSLARICLYSQLKLALCELQNTKLFYKFVSFAPKYKYHKGKHRILLEWNSYFSIVEINMHFKQSEKMNLNKKIWNWVVGFWRDFS